MVEMILENSGWDSRGRRIPGHEPSRGKALFVG